jgi:hypothetical protein
VKKTKVYNNLSQKTLDKYKLKRGEKAVFKLIAMQKDPLNRGKFIIPTSYSIPSTDRVWDEFAGADGKGEYVDVALIRTIGAQEAITTKDIEFTRTGAGIITTSGDSADDLDQYVYLSVSNFNISNPNRDPSVEGLFELVDNKKKAEASRKKRNFTREALNYAYEMKDQDVLDFGAANGWEDTEPAVLRDKIEMLAETEPEVFLEKVNDKGNAMKAIVKRALTAGIIVFDKPQSRFAWVAGNETICTVARTAGADHLQGFVDFCVTEKRGAAILEDLKKQLDKKK